MKTKHKCPICRGCGDWEENCYSDQYPGEYTTERIICWRCGGSGEVEFKPEGDKGDNGRPLDKWTDDQWETAFDAFVF